MPRVLASKARPALPWHARRADEDYGEPAEPGWREIDWPAHLNQVEIDGAKVNYVDIGAGDGTPVVLVHGLGGQWQNWLENIPRLAQGRRVIAPDLHGHWLSGMPRERITIPGYGRCVEALCEHLGLERIALVGNSMGGFVSSEVAIQFPERVERLTLVSPAGISNANLFQAPILTLGRIGAAVTAYTASRHKAMSRRPWTRHLALSLVVRHPSKLRGDFVWEAFMKGTGKKGFDDALRACLEYDFRDRLGEIRCPTLVVWGEKDTILPVKDAHEYERLVPKCRKVIMEDTGHVSMAERPGAFNDLLLDFLEEGLAAVPATGPEQAAA